MLFSIVCSILATLFNVENTAAGEVTLLDSSQFIELNWKTYSLDDDPQEHGWQEESLPLPEDDINSRSYVTCDVRRPSVDNWLQLPLIRPDNRSNGHPAPNRLWIDIAFTSRDCLQLKNQYGETDTVTCKETFGLYYYETDSAADFTAVIRNKNNSAFRPIDQIAADSGRFTGSHDVAIHREVRSVALMKKGVYFAFRDQGTCVSILKVKIFYLICNETISHFARFPSTAVGPSLTSVVKVKGQCVAHSTSDIFRTSSYGGGGALTDNRPQQICKADGQWDLLSGACQCLPGYRSEGQSACTPCPTNTYKEALGYGTCQTCPPASHAPNNGSSYCQCIPGYYRLHEDSKSSPCTTLPSKPLNFKIDRLSGNDAHFSWIEPKSRGGRHELWYKFECKNCPSTTIFEPPNVNRLNSTQIRLSNLTPGKSYVVRLTAQNDLSIQASSSNNLNRDFTEILHFTTYRHSTTGATKNSNVSSQFLEVELDHVTEDRVVLTWHKSQAAALDKNAVYQIRYKSISADYRPLKTNVNDSYANFYVDNKTSAVVENLFEDTNYVFQVRQLLPNNDWGPWSSELMTKTNLAKPVDRPSEKLDLAVSPFIYTIVFPVIAAICLTISAIAYFYWPSKTKRPKFRCLNTNPHMDYKKYTLETGNSTIESRESQNTIRQPLRPCFGPPVPPQVRFAQEFVPYVDPSTYENPENVLHHFAPIIHPSRVQILETVGEGEFGDVCRGILLLDCPNRTSGDYSVVDDPASTIHYQSSSIVVPSSSISASYEQPPSAGREQLRLIVAVKILKNETFCAKARRNFLSEAFIMGQFRHTNVVRLIGVVNNFDQPAMIVIEYMQNGSLNNFLKDKDEILGPLELVTMLAGIACGMKYLTEKGYLHRDLAARNVLVDLNLTCKIADFGLSRCTDRTDQTYVTNGGKIPVRWTAPEAIILRQFTVWSDVWSFGVCSWEVMSYGKRPYGPWTNQQVLEQVQNGYRLPKPQNCPDCIYNLILNCWADKRDERPDFARICRNLNEILN